MKYSVIVPIYNRPDEVAELLESIVRQEVDVSPEVVLVEDGSTVPCRHVAEQYAGRLNIRYCAKPNTGRSDSRNAGIIQATGDYYVFFDSDCVLPPDYFKRLDRHLREDFADCFGGPDRAHESFTPVQRAINYSMTSYLTTGGIRGSSKSVETFRPRSFNMGFSNAVYTRIGGFADMLGEDIDLSLRIARSGFRTRLLEDVFVYHKRRVSFLKFYRQVRNFGVARIGLAVLHPGALRPVHIVPAVMLLGGLLLMAVTLAGIIVSPRWWALWLLPQLLPLTYLGMLLADAGKKTGAWTVAALAVWSSVIMIVGYGQGFICAFWRRYILLRHAESREQLERIYK